MSRAFFECRVSGVLRRGDTGAWLLVRGVGDTQWHLPGGGVEPTDRSPSVGLTREIHEELGLSLARTPELRVVTWTSDAHRDNRLFCAGTIPPTVPIALDERELDEAAWVMPSEVYQYLMPREAARAALFQTHGNTVVYREW